ncbi:unnamed protein product, partial [Prorocentrum cordatum]
MQGLDPGTIAARADVGTQVGTEVLNRLPARTCVEAAASSTGSKRRRADGCDDEGASAKDWHRPVAWKKLCEEMSRLWNLDCQVAVTMAARCYVVVRTGLSMAKDRCGDLDVDLLSAGSWVSQESLREFTSTTNDREQYRCSTHDVDLPVSFMSARQMLNLHEVFSVHDPVQVRARSCIAQRRGEATDDTSSVAHWRSVLRAVIIIHATRRREYAPCAVGNSLASEQDALGCFVGSSREDPELRRQPTSEGRFFCGSKSVVLGALNRSSVMGTLDGGDYSRDFEDMVVFVQRSVAGAASGAVDAPVLDHCRDRLKNWCGFGGAGNQPGGNVDGLVAKNVAFQGLRNILHHFGFEHGAPQAFVSGSNPCKLARVYWQTAHPSREQQ